MSRSLEPYPPEVGRWLATLRDRAQPQNSHLAPGPSPADVLRLLDLIEDLAARWRAQERLLVDDIRRLPTDEFIARALEKGEYRVDLTEGRILSGTTARPIGRLRSNGYVEVQLKLEGISRGACTSYRRDCRLGSGRGAWQANRAPQPQQG